MDVEMKSLKFVSIRLCLSLLAITSAASVSEAQPLRVVRLSNFTVESGRQTTAALSLAAQGDENAIGFSLVFDATELEFKSAVAGSALEGRNATLIVNSGQAGAGRVGVLVGLPANQTFPAGPRELLVFTFAARADGNESSTTIAFGDTPITRAIAGANAQSLPATFTGSEVTITRAVSALSAADYGIAPFAPSSIVAAFGIRLATRTAAAEDQPLPTTLGGTQVLLRVGSQSWAAPLFYVSPAQVNLLVPSDIATGPAEITIIADDRTVSIGPAVIAPLAPGLFTANSDVTGVASATVLRARGLDRINEAAAVWDGTKYVALPIDLGPPSDQIYLTLYGTGLRRRTSLAGVTATVGGASIPVLYASEAPGYAGLDQINLGPLPRTLAGRGEVEVAVTVDGEALNRVRLNIK
jgi:uncharacterized protein (TIGR03437 family)